MALFEFCARYYPTRIYFKCYSEAKEKHQSSTCSALGSYLKGLLIQTGLISPRRLIERWTVVESMGTAPVKLFKTIKGTVSSCGPFLSVSGANRVFERNTRVWGGV